MAVSLVEDRQGASCLEEAAAVLGAEWGSVEVSFLALAQGAQPEVQGPARAASARMEDRRREFRRAVVEGAPVSALLKWVAVASD